MGVLSVQVDDAVPARDTTDIALDLVQVGQLLLKARGKVNLPEIDGAGDGAGLGGAAGRGAAG